jgi:putative endopeptidase
MRAQRQRLTRPRRLQSPPPPLQLERGASTLPAWTRSVPAGVDFAKYSGGTWLKTTQIPGDRTRWGAFDELREQADIHVIALVAETTAKGGAPGTDEQRIADFYASFVDTTAIESKGLKPIQPLLAEINAAKTPTELALIAARPGSPVPSPLNWGVAPDQKNPDIYVLSVNHGGLGLPNRTFYLGATAKPEIIAGYKAHVAKMLSLAGVGGRRREGQRDPRAGSEDRRKTLAARAAARARQDLQPDDARRAQGCSADLPVGRRIRGRPRGRSRPA